MPRKRLHVARHAAHLLLRPALTMNVRRASRPPSARSSGIRKEICRAPTSQAWARQRGCAPG